MQVLACEYLRKEPNNVRLDSTKLSRYLSYRYAGANSWPDAIYATLYMTVISFIIGGLLGLIMGLFLVLTGPRGVIENKFIFQILDKITSIFRAIPFIILLAILKDFTYFIVGLTLVRQRLWFHYQLQPSHSLHVKYRWYWQT